MSLLKRYDFFTSEDILKSGEAAWAKVRERAKAQGFRVNPDYGTYAVVEDVVGKYGNKYIATLDHDGDFMILRIATSYHGRKRTISEFINDKEFPHVKIRVDSNRELFALAVNHLVQLGYSDAKVQMFNVEHHRRFEGLIGGKDGVIHVSASEESFSRANKDADELIYDVKQVLELSNVRVKPKLMDIGGVLVNRKEYNEFIQRQLEVNGRAK